MVMNKPYIASKAKALKETWLAEEKSAFKGWDFSYLEGRIIEEELPWDYKSIVSEYLDKNHKLLDMGTGGGEFLLSLNHPHRNTYITEAYLPNYNLCVETLEPLGITVSKVDNERIPYDDSMFDMVINRHSSRVLKNCGMFITQQVGGEDLRSLSIFLTDDFEPLYPNHNLSHSVSFLEDAGFTILHKEECFPKMLFKDVGAIVYLAKIIEWSFPGFTVGKCLDKLLSLQKPMAEKGCIETLQHRFFIVGKK
jgi:hypothetical protein